MARRLEIARTNDVRPVGMRGIVEDGLVTDNGAHLIRPVCVFHYDHSAWPAHLAWNGRFARIYKPAVVKAISLTRYFSLQYAAIADQNHLVRREIKRRISIVARVLRIDFVVHEVQA